MLGQRPLVFKSDREIYKYVNNFWLILLIVMSHAENMDTKFAIVVRTSCLPFWFSLKTSFFELPLDGLFDSSLFRQIRVGSSSDYAGEK